MLYAAVIFLGGKSNESRFIILEWKRVDDG